MLTDRYSLLIPTFNRPAMLDALLSYLASKAVTFPIFLLDSSSASERAANKALLAKYRLNVTHLEFDQTAKFYVKISKALEQTATQYVSLCADDDIVHVDAIGNCIAELDRDASLVACHGLYFSFSHSLPIVDLNFEYRSPSVDGADFIERTCQLLVRYEALNYAVFRRDVLARVASATAEHPESMFAELFSNVVPLVEGKVKRLPAIYYGRRANGALRMNFHPGPWIAHDPEEFSSAFLDHRLRLFAYLDERDIALSTEEKKTLTQAYLIYMCRTLGDGEPVIHALKGTGSPIARVGDHRNDCTNYRPSMASELTSAGAKLARGLLKFARKSRTIKFKADPSDAVSFRATRILREQLSNDMLRDLARLIEATVSSDSRDVG